MQAVGLALWGYAGVCAVWGVRTGRVSAKAMRISALGLLIVSMTVTSALVISEGMDVLRTLLPLHLCSACALLCVAFYIHPTRAAFEFLYYAGMPGAALALCFPAVAVSRRQEVMDACFFLTHALVVFAPVLHMAAGETPRTRAAFGVWATLAAFAVTVYGANRLLGANYLFLMAAPAGTPLEIIYRWGQGAYWAALALLALGVVLLQRWAARRMGKHRMKQVSMP